MQEPQGVGEIVTTEDGSISFLSKDFEEAFHSYGGAKKEAQDLYIESSGIKEFKGTPRVLDVGLGLGYNAFATINAVPSAQIWSLELNKDLIENITLNRCYWLENFSESFSSNENISTAQSSNWRIIHCDLKNWENGRTQFFDFIWFDPFSPKNNAELWGKPTFKKLRGMSKKGTKLVTYSAAGAVRRSLLASGWSVERIPTTTQKRHWLVATAI